MVPNLFDTRGISQRQFFHGLGWRGWFQNDSSTLHFLCTLFLLLSHQFHFMSSGIRSRSLECVCVHAHAQLCSTLCDPMDCSPLGSSVHGIFQARILEWVAICYSRGSFQPRDQTHILHLLHCKNPLLLLLSRFSRVQLCVTP